VPARRDGQGKPVGWFGLPVRADALALAYPGAGDHLVLLVPGLVETEHAWRYRRSRSRDVPADRNFRAAAFDEINVIESHVNLRFPGLVAANDVNVGTRALQELIERHAVRRVGDQRLQLRGCEV